MKRSELTSWLYQPELAWEHATDIEATNPTIIITDGGHTYNMLSTYMVGKKLYINISAKD